MNYKRSKERKTTVNYKRSGRGRRGRRGEERG
jgi:hypothetical protein